ncbi:MAG: bifunctional folylpolyglutamate synthase/dihydrofolate synthase [Planctomycetia bacterium]|nr:bifunctional folylpolyglutamate synthase/dihydrofolate synthase [Planctomycetia bacterium]
MSSGDPPLRNTLPPADDARRRALDYLLSRIDYERSVAVPYGEPQYRLDRMHDLLERLGRPDRKFPIVHVAGTKGKGSTSAFVAAALTACGISCGLFTSPHLERLEERLAVDGEPCTGDELAALVERVRPTVAAMDAELLGRSPPESGPTYFELTTALALLHFAARNVAAAVLEVGMGGRLDSTNVCQSTISVITSISYDHTKQLGDTLAEIAWEKAGIIKPGVPVVSSVMAPEASVVVERTAAERGCRLLQLGREFDFVYHAPHHLEAAPAASAIDFEMHEFPRRTGGTASKQLGQVEFGLAGKHQAANCATALAVLEELRRLGWSLPEREVRRGLRELRWPARVEVIAREPCVVLDAAHNTASIQALLETLDECFTARRRILLFATTLEKDVGGMLRLLLPKFDHVVLTRYLQNVRGVPVAELQSLAEQIPCRNWQIAQDPTEAWSLIQALEPRADDLICIAGSFFIAAQMRKVIEASTAVK